MLHSCVVRIAHQLSILVLGAWVEYVDAKRKCRAIAARIEGKHELGLLANGLAQWVRRVEAKVEREAKLRQAFGFLSNRLLAMAWNGWIQMVDRSRGMRERVRPFVNRLQFKLQSIVYGEIPASPCV